MIAQMARRYVAREVVADDYRNLDKADMFSLGASMYELAKGEPLPTGERSRPSIPG